MLVCEAIAKYLVDAGVERTFGLLGEGNFAVVTSLTEQGVPFHYVRREDAAVNMADGWARRTGKIGFASVTHGGGLTNATTALIEATRRRTPLVLFTAVTPAAMLHHAQRIPAEELVATTGSGWREVRGAAYLAEDVAAAFRDAWTNKRACVLAAPIEILYDEVDALFMNDVLPESLPATISWDADRLSPDPGRIRAALDLIAAAERPLVLAGTGAFLAGAREALEQLAGQIGGLLATTLVAKGLFHGSDLHLGICGGFSTPVGAAEIQQSDLVLAFGCSLNPWTTMEGQLLEGSTVVHCDLDTSAIGKWYVPDLGIVGDARATAENLLDACKEAGIGGRSRRAALAESALNVRPEPRSSVAPFLTLDLALAMRDLLPEGSAVVTDAGHCVMDFITNLEVVAPNRFVFTINAGSIGMGLAAAIGAAVGADEGEWTFLFVGDGSLMMSAQELDTLRRMKVPLVVVVLDDGAYGAEVHYARARNLPEGLAAMDNPDFRALAAGFGIRNHELTSLDDLSLIADIVKGPSEPVLVHVPVDGQVMNRWYDQFSSSAVKVRGWGGS